MPNVFQGYMRDSTIAVNFCSARCLSPLTLCFLRSASLTPWQVTARMISLVIISLDLEAYIFLCLWTYVLFSVQKIGFHPYSGHSVLLSYFCSWDCIWSLHNATFAGLKQGYSGVYHWWVGNLAAMRLVLMLCIGLQDVSLPIFAEIYGTQLTFFLFPVVRLVMV